MTGANSSWQNNEIFLEGAFPPREVYYGNDSDLGVNVTFVEDYYIFDRQDVRAIFITLYAIVFSFCFFGNLLVILVVTLSRRLRSITNFFLANLAVADLCVGTFCVFQNLSTYLCDSWVLGDTMCKLYQFVHSLSYTASIFILVVICTERYFAIIHPITCKQILTPTRLVLVIVVVWLLSAAYSAPRFFWVQTFVNHLDNNVTVVVWFQLVIVVVWLLSAAYSAPRFFWVQTFVNHLDNNVTVAVWFQLVIVVVWLLSAAYSAPRFFWVQTFVNHLDNNVTVAVWFQLVIVVVWLLSAAYSAPRFFWVQTFVNHLDNNVTVAVWFQLVIVVVWLLSAAYSAPRFFWVQTFVNHLDNNVTVAVWFQLVIVVVWLLSAAYSAPRFFWVQTFVNHLDNNVTETICAPQRNKYNSKLFDVINFAVLYLAPLCVMTVLYSLIAAGLWRSSRVLRRPCGTCARGPPSVRFRLDRDCQVSVRGDRRPCVSVRGASSSHNVLRARRGVVRMLIVVVLTFALCNLPFHARKMWQYWSPSYHGTSTFSKLFTPLTFLVTYFNSGVNPLLYAFMSRNFRKGMRELLCCALRDPGGAKASRRSSTRSTANSAVLRSSLRLPRRRAEAGELVRSRSERGGS